MVVAEHRAHGAVGLATLAVVGEDRIGEPALHGGLEAVGAFRTAHAPPVLVGRLSFCPFAQRLEIAVVVRPAVAVQDGEDTWRTGLDDIIPAIRFSRADAARHLVRGEGAVLVIEAVAGAVRRRDVELHQVDVLADRVGRRLHLEVVEFKLLGQLVGMAELYALTGGRPEEERLLARRGERGDRRVREAGGLTVLEAVGVGSEHRDARLRVVPPGSVCHEVELHGRDLKPAKASKTGVGIVRGRRRTIRQQWVDDHDMANRRPAPGAFATVNAQKRQRFVPLAANSVVDNIARQRVTPFRFDVPRRRIGPLVIRSIENLKGLTPIRHPGG